MILLQWYNDVEETSKREICWVIDGAVYSVSKYNRCDRRVLGAIQMDSTVFKTLTVDNKAIIEILLQKEFEGGWQW